MVQSPRGFCAIFWYMGPANLHDGRCPARQSGFAGFWPGRVPVCPARKIEEETIMKRSLSLVLATSLAVSMAVTGCGGSSNSGSTAGGETASGTQQAQEPDRKSVV